jgi:hypothetical protein
VSVEVSTDGGNTWTELTRYTDDSSGWKDQCLGIANMGFEPYVYGIDLTPFVGNVVQVRWRMISDDEGTEAGFQLDDVWITAKIDNIAPVTTAILNPATPDGENDWYVSPVTITLVAADNIGVDKTYYRIDGGSWLEYTVPFTISVDGEHTVDYYSVDTVGNEEIYKSVSFKIDKTAPTVEITRPKEGYLYIFNREIMPVPIIPRTIVIGHITIEATATDATSGVDYVKFTITKAGAIEFESADMDSPYTYDFTKVYIIPSTHTVTADCYDVAGNTASDSMDFLKWL